MPADQLASSPSLTLFTIPKPFEGLISNAIVSWLQLGSDIEVILCGDDAGVAEVASERGVGHIPCVARNDRGTPIVSSAFEHAVAASRARLLGFVNTDIIVMGDFLAAVKQVVMPRFLLCGRRCDLDVTTLLRFDSPNWQSDLRMLVDRAGQLHDLAAMDYFVFPGGQIIGIPPFAVGRPPWDNWIVFHCRARGIPVIDATAAMTIIHQNHDYAHTPGGVHEAWYGPEARRNRQLAADLPYQFTLDDATHVMTPTGLYRRSQPSTLARRVQGRIAVGLRDRPRIRRLVRTILRAQPQ
jgi:hypothetical protein